jgi:hypothetical protein
LIEKAKGKRNDNNWNSWESKASETWMDHFERVEGLKHWDSGTKNNIFSCNYCGYNFDTNANTTDDLMHHIKSKHDITESKANEGLVYARIFNFEAEIQLVAEGKNKELTEEEALRIKNQYNMKTIYATATSNRGYSGYVDESEFGIGEAKASEDDYEERPEWDWLTNKSPAPEVDYDQVEYEDDGVSDISVPNTEPKGEDKNKFLDDIDYTGESIDYVYPTKATESTKSYITESEPFEEEYEEFEDSDDEIIEETIAQRKLTGYNDDSIARELHINYGVSHEEALEKVYSIEVSTNDRVSQTFFGKMYKECTESEKDELRMYSGSD